MHLTRGWRRPTENALNTARQKEVIMQAPRENTAKFKQALILSDNLGHAKIDKDFFNKSGIRQPLIATDSQSAGKHLQKAPVDLILCDANLSDVTGRKFVRALKDDPRYRDIPVLMASLDNSQSGVMRAIEAGCAGYLIRPYSLAAFERQVELAWQNAVFARVQSGQGKSAQRELEKGNLDQAISGFAELTQELEDASHYFEQGMRELSDSLYDSAISSFAKAVKLNNLYVEAYFGLAKAWQAKGNQNNCRKYLRLAAKACAEARRFRELRKEFLGFIEADAEGFNPFRALGEERLAQADYNGAVEALESALDLSPKDSRTHVSLGKAHHMRRDPDKAFEHVLKSLELSPENSEGRAIFKRLAGHEYGQEPERIDETPRFPGLMPWLLNCVLYAAGVVTELLHRRRREYA